MTRYVLDTHAYVLAVAAPKKLGKNALRVLRRIERGQDEAFVPAAVAAELAILHELRRIEIGVIELRASLSDVPGLAFLPLTLSQIEVFAGLRSIRDPFDRLIVSATLEVGARLITKDGALSTCGLVETLW